MFPEGGRKEGRSDCSVRFYCVLFVPLLRAALGGKTKGRSGCAREAEKKARRLRRAPEGGAVRERRRARFGSATYVPSGPYCKLSEPLHRARRLCNYRRCALASFLSPFFLTLCRGFRAEGTVKRGRAHDPPPGVPSRTGGGQGRRLGARGMLGKLRRRVAVSLLLNGTG